MTEPRRRGLQLLATTKHRVRRSTYTGGYRIFWQTCDWLVKEGLAEMEFFESRTGPTAGKKYPTGFCHITEKGREKAREEGLL